MALGFINYNLVGITLIKIGFIPLIFVIFIIFCNFKRGISKKSIHYSKPTSWLVYECTDKFTLWNDNLKLDSSVMIFCHCLTYRTKEKSKLKVTLMFHLLKGRVFFPSALKHLEIIEAFSDSRLCGSVITIDSWELEIVYLAWEIPSNPII